MHCSQRISDHACLGQKPEGRWPHTSEGPGNSVGLLYADQQGKLARSNVVSHRTGIQFFPQLISTVKPRAISATSAGSRAFCLLFAEVGETSLLLQGNW